MSTPSLLLHFLFDPPLHDLESVILWSRIKMEARCERSPKNRKMFMMERQGGSLASGACDPLLLKCLFAPYLCSVMPKVSSHFVAVHLGAGTKFGLKALSM